MITKVRKMLTGIEIPIVKGLRISSRNKNRTIKASIPPMISV